jgi:peroxiredoxin
MDEQQQRPHDGGDRSAPPHHSHHATPIPPGQRAPDFELKATPDQSLSLDDFAGKPLVLAFYPADWSPVCGDQMALYNEVLPEFRQLGAELVGISVDGVWCHNAFASARKLHFPLLADFEPKGAVARAYGVYRDADGTTERALFVIDGEGVVRWSYVSPVGVNPGADGILTALEGLAAKDAARAVAHGDASSDSSDSSPRAARSSPPSSSPSSPPSSPSSEARA